MIDMPLSKPLEGCYFFSSAPDRSVYFWGVPDICRRVSASDLLRLSRRLAYGYNVEFQWGNGFVLFWGFYRQCWEKRQNAPY